ncbi:glycosyltransferase family 4 protein [Oscillatoria sp. FACHB-1406]|uniref:MraY family glycosyltransferase n=1 Tax=Oscillatoria sp. FACHB-1406 TaxID=2692846 RepID=UPI00168699E6|nr:glycosyltransferase family 4 protein [Oscillatoria sp. FACHB-1406]MBD2577188.1 glycosyltransferase family 4 protein [Oscillatoria sp. FACHB-1406]
MTEIPLIPLMALSCALALVFTGLLKANFQTRFLDIPNDRSSHTRPTPRGGGLGFILAFALTAAFTHPNPLAVGLVLAPLALIGFLDDRGHVPASIRYLVQLLAAALAIAQFGTLPLFAIPFIAIAFTAFINFYNFMDGLDGLVASTAALQLAFLAVTLNQPLWWLLVAALLGFLYWNWSPAKIFMGDVGSTVLGASIAIALLNSPTPTHLWTALPITFPLIGDATYTLSRRLLKGENIFKAHRTHLYQRLQQSGWTHSQVAIAYLLVTGAIAVLISTLGLLGSVMSTGLAISAIAGGEFYLYRRNQHDQGPNSADRVLEALN